MWFSRAVDTAYCPVDKSDDEGRLNESKLEMYRRLVSSRLIILAVVAAMITNCCIGWAAYTLGFKSASTQVVSHSKVHAIPSSSFQTQMYTFSYNHTFAARPSLESNSAWESIFPPHGGFFSDTKLAPHGASLAVYHQLHCVDAIRKAYYVVYDAVMEGHNITFTELDDYATDWHTQHCIDFLRQMLMCNADLTIEEVDPAKGGITGSGKGNEHQCVLWADVKAWSIEMQEN